MTKKLYLPFLMAMIVALMTSCSKKMGELSSDYFTVTPQVLEAVGGKVPATINGKFPEKYFNKKAVVEVTPVLKWNGGEAKGQSASCCPRGFGNIDGTDVRCACVHTHGKLHAGASQRRGVRRMASIR